MFRFRSHSPQRALPNAQTERLCFLGSEFVSPFWGAYNTSSNSWAPLSADLFRSKRGRVRWSSWTVTFAGGCTTVSKTFETPSC